jgi:hypothetical protein
MFNKCLNPVVILRGERNKCVTFSEDEAYS